MCDKQTSFRKTIARSNDSSCSRVQSRPFIDYFVLFSFYVVEMTVPGKKARDLVELYRVSLEHRIEQGDWNLVCRDEELIKEVEGLLMGDCAKDTHSLGLDPLSVMEDSLQTAQGVGLKGLARAFEVLELASLNLYLCPWRKEYRVVKVC